jgi:hypothetical protein
MERSSGLYPDTAVLLGNGGSKRIKDVQVGDMLIGDDSLCKRVLRTKVGTDHMYLVIPSKGYAFACSSQFTLTLKGTNPYISTANSNTQSKYSVKYSISGHHKQKSFKTEEDAKTFLDTLKEDVSDISIADYLNTNKTFKHRTFLFHQRVTFAPVNVPFDPYIIGFWLGDGTARNTSITTNDLEIVNYLNLTLPGYGLQLKELQSQYQYSIVGFGENYLSKGKNIMINTLKNFNMKNNKHIPDIYKCNLEEVRLKVLAGLIDSDGYNNLDGNILEISQKSDRLSDDIEYLALSLGFMITRTKGVKSCIYKDEVREGIYNRMIIFGEGLEHIPVILERKKSRMREITKRATCQNFKIEYIGTGSFHGIELEGNGRFLTGDFTVLNSK